MTALITFVPHQVRVHILLPYSIVAVLAFICSALCFLLPETRDTATLENVNSLINNNNDDDQSTELTEKKPDYCEQSKEGDEKGAVESSRL